MRLLLLLLMSVAVQAQDIDRWMRDYLKDSADQVEGEYVGVRGDQGFQKVGVKRFGPGYHVIVLQQDYGKEPGDVLGYLERTELGDLYSMEWFDGGVRFVLFEDNTLIIQEGPLASRVYVKLKI
jgi:hypothetical protein